MTVRSEIRARRQEGLHLGGINMAWFGLTIVSGSMTPLILPALVQQFVPPEIKNTLYGNLRFYGLMVALFIQPVAGILSDRSRSRWGRRRPYMLVGAALSVFFVTALGLVRSYWALFAASLLTQLAANITHGALQGLIPDLVPEERRVQAAAIKAILELLPLVFISFTVARLVDAGRMQGALLTVLGLFLGAIFVTILSAQEEPLDEINVEPVGPGLLRALLLTLAFMGMTQGALALLKWLMRAFEGTLSWRLAVVGGAGAGAILLSIVIGVWFSVWVGTGKKIRRHPSYAWWVVNRLLFLTGVVSVQSFALYFVQDVLEVASPAQVTAQLMMSVGLLTLVSALLSGRLANHFGRKPLLVVAGLGAGLGAGLLLLASSLAFVFAGGMVIGIASGLFMSVNWALGTSLVPPKESGRFLGISNLAGAGAGAVGSGIGGPLADYFNDYQMGLGYLVMFAILISCFLLSSLVLSRVREP